MQKNTNQAGFTLLELIVSITILTLIFTVFFKFFSQAMLFQNRNEDEFVAINLAREVLSEVENSPELFTAAQIYPPFNISIQSKLHIDSEGMFTNSKYEDYKLQLEVTVDQEFPILRKVHIILLDATTNKMVTETYGYVKGT